MNALPEHLSADRIILHLDMDAFFASVEEVCHPHLRGKPLVVCGDPYGRSVVSTASYPARKFGIKSGMPVQEARRLCPQAIFWTGNPQKYVHISHQILDLLKEHTSQVEPFSIDEAFFELSGQVEGVSGAEDAARRIKEEIQCRFQMTSSIGISRNKLLAKLASGLGKPDGLRVLLPEEVPSVLGPLPVNILWGIGDKTARKLSEMGVRTVRELAGSSPLRMRRVFGVVGEIMVRMAQGVDPTPLIPYYEGIPDKSVGHEHTLSRDIILGGHLRHTLLRLTEQVGRRLRRARFRGRTVTVKIRFADMRTITRRRSLDWATDDDAVIYAVARQLLEQHAGKNKIRLVGVSVSSLLPHTGFPQEMIFPTDVRRRDALTTLDTIRDRFGEDSITRGAVLTLRRRSHPPFTLPSFLPPQD